MTLVINATVKTTGLDTGGNSVAYLEAIGDETVTMKQNYAGAPEYEAQQIISNTEGKVLSATITIVTEGDQPAVEVGQVISFSGHFTKVVPAPVIEEIGTTDPSAQEHQG